MSNEKKCEYEAYKYMKKKISKHFTTCDSEKMCLLILHTFFKKIKKSYQYYCNKYILLIIINLYTIPKNICSRIALLLILCLMCTNKTMYLLSFILNKKFVVRKTCMPFMILYINFEYSKVYV